MQGNAGGATWGSSAVEPNRSLMFVVSKERPAIIKLNLPGEKSRGQTLGPPPLAGSVRRQLFLWTPQGVIGNALLQVCLVLAQSGLWSTHTAIMTSNPASSVMVSAPSL